LARRKASTSATTFILFLSSHYFVLQICLLLIHLLISFLQGVSANGHRRRRNLKYSQGENQINSSRLEREIAATQDD
jgi:hypothetical protein